MPSPTWLDHGYNRQLSDKPTLRGTARRLADLRPTHPTISWPTWLRSLPREAFVRDEDIQALRIAEERERMAEETRRASRGRRRSA